MTSNPSEQERIIALTDEHKEFVTDVDGYVYWWPRDFPHGHFASHHLRWLADELDRRNAPLDAEIKAFFERQEG